jgi:RES domain-containing protein
VSPDLRRARDLQVLDQIDTHQRRPYSGLVWRVVRDGRDPLQGGRPPSRWCNGEFDVLYTSLERDGAIAEVYAQLSLQPVLPSKISYYVHQLRVSAGKCLHLTDLPMLAALGVSIERYQEREYRKTQEIADVAYFLGFDGMLVPSARWPCTVAVLFTDRIAPECLAIEATEPDALDWRAWRRRNRVDPSRR